MADRARSKIGEQAECLKYLIEYYVLYGMRLNSLSSNPSSTTVYFIRKNHYTGCPRGRAPYTNVYFFYVSDLP